MSMGRPAQFLDIAPWSMKGKDNQYFACRICKSGSFKSSNVGIAAVRNHLKPSNTGVQMTEHSMKEYASMKEHSIYCSK